MPSLITWTFPTTLMILAFHSLPSNSESLLEQLIKSAKDIVRLFSPEMSVLEKEHFKGIYLDSRKRIIKQETIFIGSLNESIVHPREIFKIALDENAAAIILLHNHPSGDPTPSREDMKITKEIVIAGEVLGIDVLDHIIIGDKQPFFRLAPRTWGGLPSTLPDYH